MNNDKRVSSGTLILKALFKKPLKRVEILQIAFDNRTSKSRFKKDVKKVKSGWWGTNFNLLLRGGMIKNNGNKYYSITELGKLNINKPFTINPIMSHKMYTDKINSLRLELNNTWKKINRVNSNNGWKKRDCLSAIEFLFEKGFIEEFTSDKFYYTKILLDKVALDYNLNLDWNSINHYSNK